MKAIVSRMQVIVPAMKKTEEFYFKDAKKISKPNDIVATSPFRTFEDAIEHISIIEEVCQENNEEFITTMGGTISLEIAEQLSGIGYTVEYYPYDDRCLIRKSQNEKGDIFYLKSDKKVKKAEYKKTK